MLDAGFGGGQQTVGLDAADRRGAAVGLDAADRRAAVVGLDAAAATSNEPLSPVPPRVEDPDLRGLTPWDQWNDDHDHGLPIPGIWPELRPADSA
jgi:hypothetical protein